MESRGGISWVERRGVDRKEKTRKQKQLPMEEHERTEEINKKYKKAMNDLKEYINSLEIIE